MKLTIRIRIATVILAIRLAIKEVKKKWRAQKSQQVYKTIQAQKQNGIYSGKICVHLDGHMVKPEYCTRACMRFLKACGYDGVRLHDLRATAATILASKGVQIKNVQVYLGHRDVQTTLSYYVHVLDADKIATANVMGDVFAGAKLASCSGSCSGDTDEATDNVIPFHSISPEKYAEI